MEEVVFGATITAFTLFVCPRGVASRRAAHSVVDRCFLILARACFWGLSLGLEHSSPRCSHFSLEEFILLHTFKLISDNNMLANLLHSSNRKQKPPLVPLAPGAKIEGPRQRPFPHRISASQANPPSCTRQPEANAELGYGRSLLSGSPRMEKASLSFAQLAISSPQTLEEHRNVAASTARCAAHLSGCTSNASLR